VKVAAQLRKENIAEYLLYMWQMEDLIRAYGCDIDRLREGVVAQYPAEDRKAEDEWYANLCDMMHTEGVVKEGHLQINKNVLAELADLHHRIANSNKYPLYNAVYVKTLPYIVELRSQQPEDNRKGEIETCFNALYLAMMLRLRKQPISAETQRAIDQITSFVRTLSEFYQKDKDNELKLDE